jgi:serine phosphatase RsbU (regulator of sigma subunit)
MDLFDEYEYQDTLLARIYADSIMYFAKEYKSNWLLGRAHQYKGWYFQDRAKFQTANSHFYKSLSYLRKAKDAQGVADAYGNLGNSYLDVDEYQKSLNSQLLSLTANENILKGNPTGDALLNARRGVTYALSNIGAVYGEIGMYEKALEYEYRSLDYEIEAGSKKGQAISYNAIAKLHKEFGVSDSSEFYFLKAMEIYKKNPNHYGFSSTLMEYSTLEGSSLSEARKIEMIKQAHQIRIDMGDAHGEAEVLVEICTIYFDDLSTDSLSSMLKRCYEIIETEELESFREDYFKIYSKYNSRLGKFQSAFFALENYLELKAVSDEKQRTHDLIVGDVKYQLENKYYNDSLQSQNEFAVKETKHAKDIAYIQNVVYLGVIGFIVLIVSLFYFIGSNRRKNRLNGILSEKNTVIQEQKSVVDEKNQSISDSINYARRLQAAILPTSEQINQFLPNSFLFFRPKDVVSGDFHWFENKGDLIFLAVADCTGHGVPGAMVSVVCSNALNRTVNEFGLIRPKDILDKTRELVIDTFAKSGDKVTDGMDISLVSINMKTRKVVFAGAHNSLWIIRDTDKIDPSQFEERRLMKGDKRSLIEYKGDKQPVGLYAELNKFNEVEIELDENDILYLFSDGLIDQFGGEKGKKFKSVPFKKGLLENCELSMAMQKTKLVKTFDDWQGDQDQIDDICVMGFRVLN